MTESYVGQAGVADNNSEFNSMRFLIKSMLGEVRTGVPVKIIAVNGGGLGAPPTVDVQPMINQIDGQGNQTPHGIIYGISVKRNQGGDGAIINDPVVGDSGHMVVSDRDSSSLLANAGAQSNPGSFRRHDLSDGVYHGAMANSATPTQYIWFQPGIGLTISDSNMNIIKMISGKLCLIPGGAGYVVVGGDGVTGSYDWLLTNSGPCTGYAKGRYA